MNAQEIIEFKLRPALLECEQHRLRLHAAWLEASTYPALTDSAPGGFTDGQVRTLDQLVYRFGRLQDAIGVRLLPALLQLVQEWRDNEPFLDKLNRAEKLGMLPSVEQWQRFRELRNQTAHEYPDQPGIVLANLRRLLDCVPMLEEAHGRLVLAAEERIRRVEQGV